MVESWRNVVNKTNDTNVNWNLHIGVHDMYKEGEFTTVLGKPLEMTGYVNWKFEPQESVEISCVSFNIDNTTSGLKNIDCSESLPYICELPI